MGEMPDRIVIMIESWLAEYHEGLDEILKELLVKCNCSPRHLYESLLIQMEEFRLSIECRFSYRKK
jgi:hypothetical protein